VPPRAITDQRFERYVDAENQLTVAGRQLLGHALEVYE